MTINARYMLDFRLIPEMIRMSGPEFVRRCREDRERFICTLFNYALVDMDGCYTPDQFRVTDHGPVGATHLLYVELPGGGDNVSVCCTAYAIACSETPDGIGDVELYTVERSAFGTTCIGAVDRDGTHINYGCARGTPEENIGAILAMAARS